METITLYGINCVVVGKQAVGKAIKSGKILQSLKAAGVISVLQVRKANGRRLHRVFQYQDGHYE